MSFDFNGLDFFGGAVLADRSCGSVSLSTSFGDVLTLNLDHDPELTMSGVTDNCELSERW